jgi:hypothetical protein
MGLQREQPRRLTLVAVAGETRTVRISTIALAAMIAAAGCAVHEAPAGVSQERRSQCTQDKVTCLDDCMPNVEWAVIPIVGWIYVPGREYLCQSHCDQAEQDCWLQPSAPSTVEAAHDTPL